MPPAIQARYVEDDVDGWSELERIRADAGAPIIASAEHCLALLLLEAKSSVTPASLEDFCCADEKNGK